MVASSNYEDLVPLFPMLRAIHHMKHSKVLVINGKSGGAGSEFTAQFGTQIAYPAYTDLKAAFESVDIRRAEKEGAEFARKALRVVEPSPNDIRDSWRLYLGVRELLAKEKANAITIDCLGGFRRGDLPGLSLRGLDQAQRSGHVRRLRGRPAVDHDAVAGDVLLRQARLRLRSDLRHQPQRSDPRALRGGHLHARHRRRALALHPALAHGGQQGRVGGGGNAGARDHHLRALQRPQDAGGLDRRSDRQRGRRAGAAPRSSRASPTPAKWWKVGPAGCIA